jgi:hypothetical protein
MYAYIRWVAVLVVATSPRLALARADARVTAVAAQLDVRQPEARVVLDLRIEVRSGWLRSFELAGLEPDLHRIEVEAPAGVAPPTVSRGNEGHVLLTWSEPEAAPQRGEHALRVAYSTRHLARAAARHPEHLGSWTLPRWPDRLTGVQVRVIGPAGLRPVPAPEPNLGVGTAHDAAPNHTSVLTYTRVELPRTEAWRVQFALPPGAVAPVEPAPPPPSAAGAQLRAAADRSAWPCLLGVCLGSLVVAKRRLRRGEAGATPLVPPLESKSLDVIAFVLCALSALLLHEAPSFALACALAGVASGLERGDCAADRSSCFDATAPAGGTLLAALYAASWLTPEPAQTAAWTFAWLATPLFFSRTRLHRRAG